MKKILYIVNYEYLSYSVYRNVAEILGKEYEHVLLLPDEPFIDQNLEALDVSFFSEVHRVKLSDSERFREIVKNRKYLSHGYTFICSLLELKKKILDTTCSINPDLIISTTDMTFGMGVVSELAKLKKIKIALFQPSFIDSFPLNLTNRLKNKISHLLFNRLLGIPLFHRQDAWGNEISDAIKYLWGQKFLRYIQNQENCIIVGNPMLRELINARSKSVANLKTAFALDSNKTTVTICTEAFKSNLDDSSVLGIYRETIRLLPDHNFLIKVHPRDDIRNYKDYFETYDCRNVRVINNCSIVEVLLISDVQVSVNSYSSVEAIVLNVPVVLVNRGIVKLPNHFNSGTVLEANNASELAENIKVAHSSGYRKNFEENRLIYIHEVFGSSALAEIESKIRDEIGKLMLDAR